MTPSQADERLRGLVDSRRLNQQYFYCKDLHTSPYEIVGEYLNAHPDLKLDSGDQTRDIMTALGQRTGVRIAAAWAEAVLPLWEKYAKRKKLPEDKALAPQRAIAAARAWYREPTEERAKAARAAAWAVAADAADAYVAADAAAAAAYAARAGLTQRQLRDILWDEMIAENDELEGGA